VKKYIDFPNHIECDCFAIELQNTICLMYIIVMYNVLKSLKGKSL